MSMTSNVVAPRKILSAFATWGMFWLIVATLSAAVFFSDGLNALLEAWQLPEYSHGPIIPVLSALLFLRQLKHVPVNLGSVSDRWVGVGVLVLSLLLGSFGRLTHISDFVAYALILWVGAILLISFGWQTGKHFWPPVLHLIYMLPLPAVLFYKVSTYLQFTSSELGVFFLQALNVPVFLDGNIIDLGVYKLHVAEACSGLRYLFPILSFSYIFAVLYKGPMWHKAVLLISAAPITVLMNSVRIAIAGYIVNNYGVEWIEGFTHFFEGWVIFVSCIMLLFLLARIMLFFHPVKMSLADALDLEVEGLGAQAMRLSFVQPSRAMITAALMIVTTASAWQMVPERGQSAIERESFSLFPSQLGEWKQVGPPKLLETSVARVLAADDYHSIALSKPGGAETVGFFVAWYADQSKGEGVHSPEVCLPSAGWEIAWLEHVDIAGQLQVETPFNINRAIIQKGEARMLVYYWFDQHGRKVASNVAAKVYLILDGAATGRTDGAVVRLTTVIGGNETDADAEARLNEVLKEVIVPLPRFVPES